MRFALKRISRSPCRVCRRNALFPGKVTRKTDCWKDNSHCPERRRLDNAGENTPVFGRETQARCHGHVNGHQEIPDEHRTGDSKDGVFCPDVGDQRSFAQNRRQSSSVERGTPLPMTRNLSVTLWEIVEVDELGEDVEEERMVEAVNEPGPEAALLEEDSLLAELIELWVAIQETSADELIEDSHDERREDGEEDVVEGERP